MPEKKRKTSFAMRVANLGGSERGHRKGANRAGRTGPQPNRTDKRDSSFSGTSRPVECWHTDGGSRGKASGGWAALSLKIPIGDWRSKKINDR